MTVTLPAAGALAASTLPTHIYDMPDDVYHADPIPEGSLSASGARRLLPPSCPARFAYERERGRPPKAAFDFGHAAHLLVLGAGPELVVIDAADWRTKAAKEARDAARDAGRVPLLPHEHTAVTTMAAALRAHPIAGELLNPEQMRAEVSLFWRDPESGVVRRARLDAVSTPDADGQPVIVDYKTTAKPANLDEISRAMWNYGYAMQADWYSEAAAAVLGMGDARFLFVFQETEPPHLVSVVEPDLTALLIGRRRNRQAIDLYAKCTASGVWPGHVPDGEIPLVGVPGWAERQYANDTTEEEYAL